MEISSLFCTLLYFSRFLIVVTGKHSGVRKTWDFVLILVGPKPKTLLELWSPSAHLPGEGTLPIPTPLRTVVMTRSRPAQWWANKCSQMLASVMIRRKVCFCSFSCFKSRSLFSSRPIIIFILAVANKLFLHETCLWRAW